MGSARPRAHSIGRVRRFTASGTEVTLSGSASRPAATGKPKLVRFLTQFHGWHDHMTSGHTNHFDGSAYVGVVPGVAENVTLLPPGDAAALRQILKVTDDIDASSWSRPVANFGAAPISPEFVALVREETEKTRLLSLFDEGDHGLPSVAWWRAGRVRHQA